LKGYRLYYSDLFKNEWKLVADENILSSESTNFRVSNKTEFQNPTADNFLKFYLTAIDSNGNESNSSDIYSGVFRDPSFTNYLIVDGFDRYGGNGSWEMPNHDFNTIYAKAISYSMIDFNISSCSNEAILNEELDLTNYDMVVWFLGDESLEDNTLVNLEQYKLALYLENGGKLLISGEDIGQDLDTQHKYSEFSDTLFYHQYLKANLMHDGLDILFEVNGQEGTLFENMNIQFGQTYPSDAPDDIEPINGAEPILNYTYMRDDTTYRKGGIAYKGTFGDSTNLGSLVYLSFPFETIGDDNIRADLMKKIQLYLGFNLVDVEKNKELIPSNIILKQNYPNPFNPTTTIVYTIPALSIISNAQRNENSFNSKTSPFGRNEKLNVKLTVYDVLGREVTSLVNQKQEPGNYQISFDAENYTSGIYYYQLKVNNYIQTRKMILLK
jgi:calcineurin-like phosphoesterase family protein